MKVVAPALLALLSLGRVRAAHADVPPPPGYTRVNYSFELAAAVEGRVIVAFPTYASNGGGVTEVIEPGKEYRTVQGYAPGLYSMTRADADALPKEHDAVKKVIEERAAMCIKATPRVYQVPTKDGFDQMRDVFRITMADTKCKAQLASTHYQGKGKKAEGGVFASGVRNIPAPFAAFEVPPIGDIGLDLSGATPGGPPPAQPGDSPASDPASDPPSSEAPSTGEPARGGCAGCAQASADADASVTGSAWALIGLLAMSATRQRRARRQQRRPRA